MEEDIAREEMPVMTYDTDNILVNNGNLKGMKPEMDYDEKQAINNLIKDKNGIGTNLYIRIYLGFVFLIASAAALAIIGRLSRYAGFLVTFKLGPTIFITGFVVNVVYDLYLYAAYTGYKNIVKSS